jgi:methyl-accepting chemotaxis protein
MPREDEEYELIPMSPIRRLEKRMSKIEESPGVDTKDFFKEIVEIIRMNQQIVDEMARANDALRIELSKLPAKLDEMISNLNELVSFIKASAIEEAGPGESLKPLLEKMDALIEGNKKMAEGMQATVESIEEMGEKMRSSTPMQPPKRRLLPPPQG